MTKGKKEKVTDKAVVQEKKTSEATELLSFDKYIEKHKPHYGLVASFKHEASKTENGLADRTEDKWKLAFEAQSKKTYN